jgi:hypothetical protein
LDGIVILGGLIIDPNYKGKLIFGLFNLSSRDYPLLPDRKLVAGVFFKVAKKTDIQPESIDGFSDELIKTVVGTKPNSISAITSAIEGLRVEIQDIKSKLYNDEKWKIDFQAGLTSIEQLVNKMGEKLEKEIDTRQSDVHSLQKDNIELKNAIIPMSKLERRVQLIKGIGVGVLIGLIVYIIQKYIG